MYIQEFKVKNSGKINPDDLIDMVFSLLSSYRMNGQILSDEWANYYQDNVLYCILLTPEKDSLEEKYNNSHANNDIKKLESSTNSKIGYKTLGDYMTGGDCTCHCTKSSYSILKTTYISLNSPILCGDCGFYIPLYKLPKIQDDDYYDIIHWKTQYIACDELNMSCGALEKSATREIQDLNSYLSKKGREICNDLEKLTKIPFYYYLYNYRTKYYDKKYNLCPGCGKEWNLEEEIHDLFTRKCDECRIISHQTLNS